MNILASTAPNTLHPAATAQWQRLLAALSDAGNHVFNWPHAQTEISKAQAVRHMQRVLYTMFLTAVELDDPDYPTLKRLFDSYWPLGNSNPDCTYFHATVSPKHDYRIFGKRGTSRIVEVQLMDGHFVAGPNHKSLGSLQKITADANGEIEVILSATAKPGAWLPMAPGVSWLYLRQYFYDWDTEVPADLVIERIGASYPPPVITTTELRHRVDRLIGWIPSWYRHLTKRVEGYYEAPRDALYFMTSSAGMDGLSYGKGWFDLKSDEAVIVEFLPPRCDYWSFQVMNNFWETQEFDTHQTSLNGHQAVLDAGGAFRGVISLTDPGVPNWLDPVGHGAGTICARVLYPAATPAVALRTIKLRDLPAALPTATPSITAAERSATLRRRWLSVRRRYRE
jgi:hypothetical protein